MRPLTRTSSWPWSCWHCLIWTGFTRWHATDWLFRWRYGYWPLCTRIEHQRWRVHDSHWEWHDVWGQVTALGLTRRGKIIFACAVMLLWFLARQQFSQMDDIFFQPSVWGAKGLSLYLIGDYSGAARAYRAHLQKAYQAGRTTGDLTLDEILRGDLRKARELSHRALEQAPEDLVVLLDAGEIALEENDLPAAVEIFDRILQEHPDHADASVLASVAYARSGDDDNAIASLNRTLRHSRIGSRPSAFFKLLETTGDKARLPDGKKPLCLLANYYRYLRIFDERNGNPAIAYAEKAIAAGDRPSDAYLAMGIVLEKEARPEQALDAFLQAIEADPKHAEAYRWAATIYSTRGGALLEEYRMWKGAYNIAPDDLFYADSYIRFLSERLGDLHQALKVSLRALESSPGNLGMLRHAGDVSSKLGEYEQAIRYYRQLLILAPRSAEAYEKIGFSFLGTQQHEEARTAFRTALDIDPYRPVGHRGLGSVYQRQQRYKEAIAEFETALRLGVSDIDFLANLCSLYHFETDYQRAADCFQKVIAQDPNNKVAMNLLPYTLKNLRPKDFQ
jgi:tetratricopeptide (TPR) repeat protein